MSETVLSEQATQQAMSIIDDYCLKSLQDIQNEESAVTRRVQEQFDEKVEEVLEKIDDKVRECLEKIDEHREAINFEQKLQ